MMGNAIATGTLMGVMIPRQSAVSVATDRLADREVKTAPPPSQPTFPAGATASPESTQTTIRTTNNTVEQSSADRTAEEASSEQQEGGDTSLKARLEAEQQKADQLLLQQLRTRDREVRMHEAAHAAVGGRYAGTPQFDFQRGPDGAQYAVGGEVSISTSKIPGDPQATLEKARVVRAAALAPAEPSAQDRRVAAKASQMEIDARVELQELIREEKRTERVAQAETFAKQQFGEDTPPPEADEEVVTQVFVSTAANSESPANAAALDPETGSEQASREDGQATNNARESLEKILLAGKTVAQQLNEMGLIDPQNPYGKSGLIEFIV